MEKVVEANKIFDEVSEYFDDYDVECLHSTVQKGIPEFFKWYDIEFCPQNTILTLDYPILQNIQDCKYKSFGKNFCFVRVLKGGWNE